MASVPLKYAVVCLLLWILGECRGDSVTVSCSAGNIEGFSRNENVDGQMKSLTTFLGIPYAEPPIGTNRFKRPVPKGKFNMTYIAKSFPSSCFQKVRASIVNFSDLSEDCLSLNIFVPGDFNQNKSYPVMVWIHGGGFTSGSSKNYPSNILSTFGNVVVVTINYRLGALGFLKSSDGTLIGNQGLWDQQLAIQWVHDNIRSFQGNPDEVTIFGESAGSMSVIAQALYAGNRGLFKRVIAQSGSVFGYWIYNVSNAEGVLNATGCLSASDQVACLQAVPARDLTTAKAFYYPFVDGTFLVGTPEHITGSNDTSMAAAKEMFCSVDILIGVNSQDGGYQYAYVWPDRLNVHDNINELFLNRSMFLDKVIPMTVGQTYPTISVEKKKILEKYLEFEYTDWKDPDNTTRLAEILVELSSDSSFFKYMSVTLRERLRLNQGRTYAYEFGIHPTKHVIRTPSWLKGANHADDLHYVFGDALFQHSNIHYTDVEKDVSRAMMTTWTNFAKTSNPNSPEDAFKFFGAKWPEYDMKSQSFLKITDQLTNEPIQHRFYPKRTQLWLEVFPEIAYS